MEIPSKMEITNNSIFDKKEVYTVNELEEIVKYAKIRGVRVIPGVEAPNYCASYTNATNYNQYRTNCSSLGEK